MSYYSEMAARIADVDKRVEAALRAKDNEIASLKHQLNTVLSGTVSLRSYEAIVEELDETAEERDVLQNSVCTLKREVERANERADTAAWQAVSREASVDEINSLREELAVWQKGLTLEDIRLALHFKTMHTEQLEFQQHYNGYERVVKVWFALYPDAKPMKENDLWKFLRSVEGTRAKFGVRA